MGDPGRWPSDVGHHGKVATLNHIGHAKWRGAIALLRDARLDDPSPVLDESSPVFPTRYSRQTLVTTAHHTSLSAIDRS
jgi:hypothetical protein